MFACTEHVDQIDSARQLLPRGETVRQAWEEQHRRALAGRRFEGAEAVGHQRGRQDTAPPGAGMGGTACDLATRLCDRDRMLEHQLDCAVLEDIDDAAALRSAHLGDPRKGSSGAGHAPRCSSAARINWPGRFRATSLGLYDERGTTGPSRVEVTWSHRALCLLIWPSTRLANARRLSCALSGLASDRTRDRNRACGGHAASSGRRARRQVATTTPSPRQRKTRSAGHHGSAADRSCHRARQLRRLRRSDISGLNPAMPTGWAGAHGSRWIRSDLGEFARRHL